MLRYWWIFADFWGFWGILGFFGVFGVDIGLGVILFAVWIGVSLRRGFVGCDVICGLVFGVWVWRFSFGVCASLVCLV